MFSTDNLELKLCEIRQGSGGTYFITVQNSLEKIQIQRPRLLLHLKVDLEEPTGNHECLKCIGQLDENYCNLLEQFNILEEKLRDDVKSALFYIARYISLRDVTKEKEETFFTQKNTECTQRPWTEVV